MRRITRWGLLVIIFTLLTSVTTASPAYQEFTPELLEIFLGEARADVETLADRAFPGAIRPDNWIGNTDVTSASMLADLFIDNELLADQIFEGTRPLNWIGASTTVRNLVARNIRHDLELSADAWLGVDVRPDDWFGGPVLFTCDRTLMNTVYLLQTQFPTAEQPDTPETVFDYCDALAQEIEGDIIPEIIDQSQIGNIPDLLLAVRGDIERLADEVLGVNVRPGGWVDNTDVDDLAFAADLDNDIELLADIVLNNQRPRDWIASGGGTSPLASLRILRFNLELLTDRALGIGTRPSGWQGDSEIFRCEPTLQSLVSLVSRLYQYELPTTTLIGPEYCALVNVTANFAAENPPPPEVLEEIQFDEQALIFTAESRNAFSYLDPAALVYMGVMPWGTGFRAWYRNFGDSTMMFVSGEDFALFIDRRWTTMSQETFDSLPTLDGRDPLTFCDANWCNGPAPTPTPTGSGPILDIINSGTEPAENLALVTPDADTEGLQLVTWNFIRVNYLLFRPEAGVVQVTLELCTEPSQIICEPVISVFNNNLQQGVPVLSQSGGLNVYELPFGYRTEFTIESATLFSNDVWLNDPSLVGDDN